jgi:inhibitor of cysteine peptidase
MPLILVALVLALSGCGDDAGEQTLSETDANTRFLVESGDVFTVVLESNPSTGYRWDLVEPLPREVLRLSGDSIIESDDEELVGASWLQQMEFEAVGDGSTFIQLWYIRPFDDPPEPADRAQFEVIVGSGVPADAGGPSEGDEPQSTIPDDEDALSVGQVMTEQPAGEIIVSGLLFDDGSGLVLCEALAESFPPQCPGEALVIANPEDVVADFTQSGSVRWTDRVIVLMGELKNGRLEVTGL